MEERLLENDIIIWGKTIKTSNAEMSEIGKLWQMVSTENHQAELFGIYHLYESNEFGHFSLTVGGQKQAAGYSKFTIPAGKYLVIKTETNDLAGVQKAWQAIWQNMDIVRKYAVDFEWYHEDGTIEIYLSIL